MCMREESGRSRKWAKGEEIYGEVPGNIWFPARSASNQLVGCVCVHLSIMALVARVNVGPKLLQFGFATSLFVTPPLRLVVLFRHCFWLSIQVWTPSYQKPNFQKELNTKSYLCEFLTKLHPLTSQTYERPSLLKRSNPQTCRQQEKLYQDMKRNTQVTFL